MPKRIVPTSGAVNFRDLGGYAAADGRRVKWGRVYRSDELSDLSRDDLVLLAKLDLHTIVDFRGVDEATASPDMLPVTIRRRVDIPIEAGRVMGTFFDGALTFRKSMGMMQSVYRALAADFQDSYREFFRLLAAIDNTPLVFHCAAGKDRTGFGAALFLASLGVGRDDIMEDYLLSRVQLQRKFRLGEHYSKDFEPLYMVYPEFLQAAFEVVDNTYGGFEAYLDRQLGVDRGLMMELYSEPGRD